MRGGATSISLRSRPAWPAASSDELPGGSSTKNQALAGLRHFFDTLVTGTPHP